MIEGYDIKQYPPSAEALTTNAPNDELTLYQFVMVEGRWWKVMYINRASGTFDAVLDSRIERRAIADCPLWMIECICPF